VFILELAFLALAVLITIPLLAKGGFSNTRRGAHNSQTNPVEAP
jgi:hypothetical protein